MTHLIGGVIGKVHVTTWRSCQESIREKSNEDSIIDKNGKTLGKIVWDQAEEILEM